MKKIISPVVLVIVSLCLMMLPGTASAASRTNGYTKKNGTYVQPYYRSTPNKTKIDNYSTKGNVNPFTGKKGYASAYKAPVIKSYPKTTTYKISSPKLPKAKSYKVR